jgi:hypothetical protein
MKTQSSLRAVLALGFTASVLAMTTISTTRSADQAATSANQVAYRASGRVTQMANRGSGRLELIAHRASGRFNSQIN